MSKKRIRTHFGRAATNYAAASIHAQGEDLQWLTRAAPLQGNESVLDVGTGAGHAALAFAPYVKRVQGIDITLAMLEQADRLAQERGIRNVVFFLGDAEDIPYQDAAFDIVVSRWCAHHYSDVRKAVQEIARVLKPGGSFLLLDSIAPPSYRMDTFINTLEYLRDTGHVRNYSIAEWSALMEAAGLVSEVKHTFTLRLDGAQWVERIGTPPRLVEAIRQLLSEADETMKHRFRITDAGPDWGFDLPAAFLQGTKA